MLYVNDNDTADISVDAELFTGHPEYLFISRHISLLWKSHTNTSQTNCTSVQPVAYSGKSPGG